MVLIKRIHQNARRAVHAVFTPSWVKHDLMGRIRYESVPQKISSHGPEVIIFDHMVIKYLEKMST